jgi:hypothetical protein
MTNTTAKDANMADVVYYAAYQEGTFGSAEDALACTGLSKDRIELALGHSRVNLSPAVWWPLNDDYGALVTEDPPGVFTLWRGFHGSGGSHNDARAVIQQFTCAGLDGTWAIFEWTPPPSRSKQ